MKGENQVNKSGTKKPVGEQRRSIYLLSPTYRYPISARFRVNLTYKRLCHLRCHSGGGIQVHMGPGHVLSFPLI